jgi:outer membrane receptor protein involved in Fe transport
MMRNRYVLLTMLFCLFSFFSYSQSQDAALKGKVTDATTGETLPYAQVLLTQGGVQKGGKQTDFDGNYRFEGLQPGSYDVTVRIVGYAGYTIQNISLIGDKTQTLDIKMQTSVFTIKDIVVIWERPLFEKDQTTTTNTITREQVQRSPVKGVNYLATTTAGVVSSSNGININGQRGDGTVYYVDGVKVIGSASGGVNIPQTGIEQISVITAGLPAEYGDATGGVITITTRGPSSTFSGGVDLRSSQYLDPYGYNSIEANLTGPILKTKATENQPSRTLLGYFFAGSATYQKDPAPSGIPLYEVKPDVLASLKQNPLHLNPRADAVNGLPAEDNFIGQSNFITNSGIQSTKIRPNTPRQEYNVTGKLDFQPVQNVSITAGGSANYAQYLQYIGSYSLFNSENNPQVITQNYRGYVRFKQYFTTGNDSHSYIKNAYYSLQADYSTARQNVQDQDLKDDYFSYGYVGKFDVYSSRKPAAFDRRFGEIYIGPYGQDSVHFTPMGSNTVAQNYTRQYFDYENSHNTPVFSREQITRNGGLLNGSSPALVNSLWAAPGSKYGFVSHSNTDQFNVYFTGAADIKNHSLKFGINYEQRISRFYSVGSAHSASELWTLARQLTNQHLTVKNNADTSQFARSVDANGNFTDTLFVTLNTNGQRNFDKNFRNYLINKGARDNHGRYIDQNSYINIDQYSPSDLKLSMFSADELLNQGNSYINYYGYDYLGNKKSTKTTVNDFLLDTLHRYVAPYSPIYIAGFIQDKFDFHDITFRIGLRVDRFDANQQVLKDPFSLYPTRTVGEINNQIFGSTKFVKPSTIGDDYVPYVNDPINPTATPVGFRDPKTNIWYDATGKQVNDVNYLASLNNGKLTPYLAAGATAANSARPVSASFVNYTPQVTYSPRVSFSFPISQEAVFYANYDIMSQRPKAGNQFIIDDYYFLKERSTSIINNPALKPEQRINYEIGFKQKISDASALTIQAFYGEIRNLVQLRKINFAYPVSSYTTFGNIDFGTVKGLTFIYDLRRKSSQGIELNANYTLQFANGTGSDAGTANALIEAGQPNLRTPLPLDYDIRHQINTTIDYRFGIGPEYTGPSTSDTTRKFSTTLNNIYHGIFENAGFFFVLSGRSGTPYSQQSNVTQDVSIGVAQRRSLLGEVNGARLPWSYRIDFTFDKNLVIKSHKTQANSGGRPNEKYLNIYVTVQNILNTATVVSVYRYTGLPGSDGFLASAEGQRTLNGLSDLTARQAFYDQYNLKTLDPGHYGAPRIIRLGLRFNF